jgi:RimJ/RimL family protein N-acetyltransferase
VPRLTEPAVAVGKLARTEQPTIRDEGLVLRPWELADLPVIVAAYADPTIQQWHARTMTEAEARSWLLSWLARWRLETGVGWAVASEAGDVLGQISLRALNHDDGTGEVSYWVLPGARGNHVASRALRAVSGWLFDDVGLHRVEVNHSTANPASCRVAINAGYVLEGTKRSEALHADGWHDMHLHARLDSDPAP